MDILCDAIGFTLPPDRVSRAQPGESDRPRNSPAPQSRSSPSSQFGPVHCCHLCNRTYERADHLNRHLRSHENARPHKCTRCAKSFNRADLLNRHTAGHNRVNGSGDNRRPRIERGERVAAACKGCVTSKSKCQDRKPCVRCVKKGIACQNSDGNVQKSHSAERRLSSDEALEEVLRKPSAAGRWGYGTGPGDNPQVQSTLNVQDPQLGEDYTSTETGLHSVADHQPSLNNDPRATRTSASGYYSDGPASNTVTTFFDESFQDFAYLPGEAQFNTGLGLTPRDSYFTQDLDFGMWDIDLDSIELAYEDVNKGQVEQNSDRQTNGPQNSLNDVSKRYAAFERSPWLWTPTQKDQALNDQNDLNLDEETIPSVLTPASTAASLDDFSSCCIDFKMRDQMLALLFTLRKTPTQVPSFPSLVLLNSIIQVYFVQESFRVDNLIHSATFNSKKALPQLLIAIVAAGSTLISTPAIWKMGLALQEVVRHTVADFWEQNNTNTRNLQALQAFMICLDLGLWSGFKRKMEIAESFAQPVIIMLRRAHAFAAPRNTLALIPDRNDSEEVLEIKWQKWAERESLKRLVLHLFMHDIHASIGLQKPPLISFTELKFALPAPRSVWLAKSATEWRDHYLSANFKSSSSIPSFMDVMQMPDLFSQLSDQIDVHLSSITLIHGFWGQVWALLESKKFYPPSKATHRLCLITSHTEVYRDLSALSTIVLSLTRNSPEVTLISELLMMILHASPEDLQRFAGKFGEDEARKSAGEFQDWGKGIESRIAVWHAGQVFRAAKRFGQAQLRGFNAIAVYYASLTLWIYGLMTSSSRSPAFASSKPPSHIILNEEEGSQTRSWRSSDDGIPGINVMDLDKKVHFVPLEDTARILGTARDIYRSNFQVLDEPLPPLVENLANLLRDLGSLPGSRVSRAASPA